MKIIFSYEELSQLLKRKVSFKQISENQLEIIGKVDLFLFKDEFKETLTIERVGYSSIDFSITASPMIISTLMFFLPSEIKGALVSLDSKKYKLDFRKIPDLMDIVGTIKLDSIIFEEKEITVSLSPRRDND